MILIIFKKEKIKFKLNIMKNLIKNSIKKFKQ